MSMLNSRRIGIDLKTNYNQIILNNKKIITNKLPYNHTKKICKENIYQIQEIEKNINKFVSNVNLNSTSLNDKKTLIKCNEKLISNNKTMCKNFNNIIKNKNLSNNKITKIIEKNNNFARNCSNLIEKNLVPMNLDISHNIVHNLNNVNKLTNNNITVNKISFLGKSTKAITSTIGLTSKALAVATLVLTVSAGLDIYQTYQDAIQIDISEHITRTDGSYSADGNEVNVELGLDIPKMGFIDKRLDVSVDITVIDSNPTTEESYSLVYTLGEGEKIYDFVLKDLDPVTTSKIESGEPIDIEYSGSVTVVYLGMELTPTKTEIPKTIFTIENT